MRIKVPSPIAIAHLLGKYSIALLRRQLFFCRVIPEHLDAAVIVVYHVVGGTVNGELFSNHSYSSHVLSFWGEPRQGFEPCLPRYKGGVPADNTYEARSLLPDLNRPYRFTKAVCFH